MDGSPWSKVLGTIFILSQQTLSANIYTDFASVNTTVSYNSDSGTYDIAPETPFSIGFSYKDVPVMLSFGEVRWAIIRKPHFQLFRSDVSGEDVVDVSPKQVDESPSATGTLWISLARANPELYSPLNNTLTYSCDMLTLNGTDISSTDTIIYRSSINISVVEPATITNISDSQIVTIGDTVKLECLAQGLPKPDVVWSRADGKALINTEHDGIQHKGSVLLLRNLTEAADATYRCSASNRVTELPPTQSVTVTVLHPPVLKVHLLVVYQKLGYHTELQCSVRSANPSPTSSGWYYTSKSDRSASRVDIKPTDPKIKVGNLTEDDSTGMLVSTLVIDAVSEVDYTRLYCCRISNSIGEAESCMSVRASDTIVLVNGQQPRKGPVTNTSSDLTVQGLLSVSLCLLVFLIL
ncbi:lachesin-like [Watersipora subatra]|uniref:lachesin-like n=1 Tax=Watersipora subatra TaxID=2589382 RepID=UPI00355C54DE